jgi:hypothetical protein
MKSLKISFVEEKNDLNAVLGDFLLFQYLEVKVKFRSMELRLAIVLENVLNITSIYVRNGYDFHLCGAWQSRGRHRPEAFLNNRQTLVLSNMP